MRPALLILCSAITLPLAAQDKKKPADDTPKVLYAAPLAVHPGFKGKVTLRGLKLDTVTEVTADPTAKLKLGKPKAAAGPKDYPAAKVGDTELELELELPKDFAGGTLDLVAVGPKGKAEPYKMTVTGPGVAEKEPNDRFAAAQELTLPVAVDAKIDREKDPDVYRFAGMAGRKVTVEVRAARHGSPVDALVTVYDADRRVLDSCDDADGSADPVLTVTLPRDGTYYLTVIDAHDAGGAMFPYRLLVSAGK
jgi:hypothetical protein